jgi:F1F0 ATPase subunit 2
MNSEIYILALILLAGFGLGIFYFGGLWLTVKRLPDSRRRISLVVGSFLGRNAVCFGALVLIVRGGHWERVLVCMLGFIIARILLIQRLRPRKAEPNILKGKIRDEYQS